MDSGGDVEGGGDWLGRCDEGVMIDDEGLEYGVSIFYFHR